MGTQGFPVIVSWGTRRFTIGYIWMCIWAFIRGNCPTIGKKSKVFYTNYVFFYILSFGYNYELQNQLGKKAVKLARFCIRMSRFFLVSGFC